MFIQHLATTTHNVVKAERKPRRNIQYRDVSSAIAKTDNLEFAVDVVPKTMLFKEARKRKGEREEREKEKLKEREEGVEEQGEADVTTAPASPPAAAPPRLDGAMDVDERVQNSEPEDEDPAAMQLEMEMRGPPRVMAGSSPEQQKVVAPKSPEAKSPEVKVNSPEQKAPATRRLTGGFTSINGAK
jgi:DNA polymerase epsilon subunit 4